MKDFELSVEDYQKILQNLHLDEIALNNLTVKRYEENFGKEFGINIKSKASHTFNGNLITFYYQFTFSAKSPEKEKSAIKIVPEYKIEYSKSPDLKIDPEFYEIFPEASLKFIVWPYFREIVQNIISRMNLPPLALPTIM